MAGELITYKQLTKKIKQVTSSLTRRDDGFFLKQAPAYLGGV